MTYRTPTRLLPALISAFVVLVVTATTAACELGMPERSMPTRVVIGYSAWPGWFPWKVAEVNDLFAKNGVSVEMRYFDNYTKSLEALQSGAIDANAQTLSDTLASIKPDSGQTVVLVNDNSTGNDKIIAREGINSISDLKGKRIAVEEFAVDHFLLLLALEQAGLTQRDVVLKPLPTGDAAEAFVKGDVDAVGVFAPFTDQALKRPGSKAIATSGEFPGAIPDLLVAKPALVKDRPNDVQAIVDTWFETLSWIKDNRAAATEIMRKQAGGVSVAEYKAYDSGTTIFTRRQNVEAFTPGTTPKHLNLQANKIADFMLSSGMLKNRPSLDGLFDDRFVKAAAK